MKLLFVTLLCVVAFAYGDDKPAETTYTTKYDGIDLDEILQSERLFKNYYNCLMDKGKCPPDGRELKQLLPDALQTECSKCSEKQKQGVEKVLKFLIENKKDEWKELQAKYDPEGIYYAKYKPEAEKRGYKIPESA